ncbi:MAG: hypothetical protein V3U11_07015 [Planctomycetota bacterium]
MNEKILMMLKIAVLCITPALAVMASLYVLDVLTGEAMREAFLKIMAIAGIFTGSALVTVMVSSAGKS